MDVTGREASVVVTRVRRVQPIHKPGTRIGRARDWVRHHQLISFYLMTFSISWGLGLLYVLADSDSFEFVFALALCGPAFAAIGISSLIDTDRTRHPRRHYWLAFLGAWLLSAIMVFLASVWLFDTDAPLPALAVVSPVIAVPVASVIAAARSRRPGVRRQVGSLIKLRGVWRWVLLALVFIPALLLLAQPLDRALGAPASDVELPATGWVLAGLILLRFCYQLLYFNATGEEVGWRGFALPRLQARTSPLMAALVIGVFWAPWHFFLWQSEDRPVGTLEFWVEMFSAHLLFSVLLVWICNRAGGSILVAGVGHAATNTAFRTLPLIGALAVHVTWLGAALILIIVDRMWRRLPPDHPVVYRTGEGVGVAASVQHK